MSFSEDPEAKDGTPSTHRKSVQAERAGSPVPSCLSMRSERSMENPLYFRGQFPCDPSVQAERTGSPVPSCLSMRSERSMENPLYFRGQFPCDPSVQAERTGSPVPSCLSMRSERSMENPLYFRGQFPGDPRIQRPMESSHLEENGSEKLSFPKQSLLCTLMKLKTEKMISLTHWREMSSTMDP
ncbi:hypothetical protein ANANG_G00217030 [Anguilla anguilla]|uniref:Uncharacterized protein n=1 Tax=Anguilla anguilla TaxID=7936 RepID=A0A9D3LWS9_ANGAN|nr:hypothetical protein ANANG_G00217030 [Anguilla anguilla]